MIGVSVADLANRGDYITEATHYVILGDGESSVNLTVPTQDVDGASLDGVLVATIQSGIGYSTPIGTTRLVDILDGDETKEVLTVNALANENIKEGADAVFVVSRTGTSGLLTYQYDLIVTGDLYDGAKDNVEGTIADGDQTDTITITTKSLDALLPSGAGINLRILGLGIMMGQRIDVVRCSSVR